MKMQIVDKRSKTVDNPFIHSIHVLWIMPSNLSDFSTFLFSPLSRPIYLIDRREILTSIPPRLSRMAACTTMAQAFFVPRSSFFAVFFAPFCMKTTRVGSKEARRFIPSHFLTPVFFPLLPSFPEAQERGISLYSPLSRSRRVNCVWSSSLCYTAIQPCSFPILSRALSSNIP